MAEVAAQCLAIKKDGTRCKGNFALSPEGLCPVHDPARSQVMREGIAKSVVVRQQQRVVAKTVLPEGMLRPPKTLSDAVRWSAWAMHAAVTGVIDARTAHEVGYLCNAFKAALEKRDLEREIEQLRAELAAAKQSHARPRIA